MTKMQTWAEIRAEDRKQTPGPWRAVVWSNHAPRTIMATDKEKGDLDHDVVAEVQSSSADAWLIAGCPMMYDYIVRKANEGDPEAAEIVKKLEQPVNEWWRRFPQLRGDE